LRRQKLRERLLNLFGIVWKVSSRPQLACHSVQRNVYLLRQPDGQSSMLDQ
jgi:hypothetical protein